MKKTLPILIVFITLFLASCSQNDDNTDQVLLEQIQGKWKLTELVNDTDPFSTPVTNGYEMELLSDGTFISNEENGFTGGTYTVINSPGKNLRLIYKKEWDAKVVYKYISSVTDQNLYLQGYSTEPFSDEFAFFGADVWTRIP
jgi:hypothetical protein